MTPEDKDEITALCNRVIEEKDPRQIPSVDIATERPAGADKSRARKIQAQVKLAQTGAPSEK